LSRGSIAFILFFTCPLFVSFPTSSAALVSACQAGQCWYEVGPPVFAQLGAYQAFRVSYVNFANANVTGIVYLVVHNRLGQTAEYSTATLQLAAGANGTTYPITFGLPSGEYSATLFVATPSGLTISVPTTASFAV
jgi:hypothetical protein